jgi:hypothetical protein
MRLRLPKSINCCKQLVDKWSIFSQIRRIGAKLTPDLGNTRHNSRRAMQFTDFVVKSTFLAGLLTV